LSMHKTEYQTLKKDCLIAYLKRWGSSKGHQWDNFKKTKGEIEKTAPDLRRSVRREEKGVNSSRGLVPIGRVRSRGGSGQVGGGKTRLTGWGGAYGKKMVIVGIVF